MVNVRSTSGHGLAHPPRRAVLAGIGALLGLAACDAQLPDISPEQFACFDDRPSGDGTLPCLASDFCFEAQCTRRWDCNDRSDGAPGCRPDTTRCELVLGTVDPDEQAIGSYTAAVRCMSGVHTSTTTIPQDRVRCECPDGLVCVAYGGAPGEADYPLFVLLEGGALPTDQLGISGETVSLRRCVRACSGEVDCPADHSCRPAAVVNARLQPEGDSGRQTVGVCYPNVVVDTSTTTRPPAPDPAMCRQNADCAAGQVCRAGLFTLDDHPVFPAGDARGPTTDVVWATRCAQDAAGLGMVGSGCTTSPGCGSGVCLNGRCQRLCDPLDAITACRLAPCRATRVERTLPDGESTVSDQVFLCR